VNGKQWTAVALVLICTPLLIAQTFGVRKRMPRPEEFGNVTMTSTSESGEQPAAVFKHWVHRAKYTCRLCHVDLGFAMIGNETGVTARDNAEGIYCGACHDGQLAFEACPRPGEAVDANESECARCHSDGLDKGPRIDFYDFVEGFPKARFGNRVDWMVAEDMGLFELVDSLPGISIPRAPLINTAEQELDAKVYQMPDIVFSH
jgi:c(7)-type cytochrome triheme protein